MTAEDGRYALEKGQLDAEANHHGQNQSHDKVLENADLRHRAVWPVEQKND